MRFLFKERLFGLEPLILAAEEKSLVLVCQLLTPDSCPSARVDEGSLAGKTSLTTASGSDKQGK